MSGIKKNNWRNPEEPYELFKAAQRDIITINDSIEGKKFKVEDKVETICRCAAESTEKMLKGWIINTNYDAKVYGIHDLGKLYDIANNMNSSFSELKDKLNNLNEYTTALRYNSRSAIDEHEVKECLINLKYIYDFPLIKETRDNLNIDNNFVKLPDNINTLFGEFGQNIISTPKQ